MIRVLPIASSDLFDEALARPWLLASIFGVAFLWNGLAMAWRARRLRRDGKTVLGRVPEGALFVERWSSGASGLTFLTRLGGARNCLLVALTKDRLLIRPHCPFILLPPFFDLEHDLPLSEIAGAKAVGDGVELSLPGRVFTLHLRKPREFMDAWAAAYKIRSLGG